MSAPKENLSNTIYNISSFNPSVSEFYFETKKYFENFEIDYTIDTLRQNIVNSWPNNIDHEIAKKDWMWNPKYNFSNAYKKYLVPTIIEYYKGK